MIANRIVITVIAPSHSRCSVCLDVCGNNPHVKKIINWSIVQYEQWEHEGTAEMAEFSAGLQTRQEEWYVIWFWLILGGDSMKGDNLWRLLVPQFPRKIGGDAPIQDRALNRANTVIELVILERRTTGNNHGCNDSLINLVSSLLRWWRSIQGLLLNSWIFIYQKGISHIISCICQDIGIFYRYFLYILRI